MARQRPTDQRLPEQPALVTDELSNYCPAAACVLEFNLQTLRTLTAPETVRTLQRRKDALQTAWEAYTQMQDVLLDWEQQLLAYQTQEAR